MNDRLQLVWQVQFLDQRQPLRAAHLQLRQPLAWLAADPHLEQILIQNLH